MTALSPAVTASGPDILHAPRIPFGRLVAVEARKSVDTRAAKAVLGAFLGVGVLILAFTALKDPTATLTNALLPAALVLPALPVIGVLAMTSEWSQRTASTTFRYEPRRVRVLLAKLCAAVGVSVVLVAAVILACLALTAVALLLRGQPLAATDMGPTLRMVFVSAVMYTLFGVAWGSLLMVTPVAILFAVVSSLILEPVVSFFAGDLAPWFDSATPVNWLTPTPGDPALPFSGGVVTGFLLWYVAPLVAGIWVQARREAR